MLLVILVGVRIKKALLKVPLLLLVHGAVRPEHNARTLCHHGG